MKFQNVLLEVKSNKRLIEDFERMSKKQDELIKTISHTTTDKQSINYFLSNYYEPHHKNKALWQLRPVYEDRTDNDLLSPFEPTGLLHHYRSDDVLLRTGTLTKILDWVRKEVIWE